MDTHTGKFDNIEENIEATKMMIAYEQGRARLYEVFIPENEKTLDNKTVEDIMMI